MPDVCSHVIGRKIIELRAALGFTQHDLARALNVDMQTLRRWERATGDAPSWVDQPPANPGPKGLALAVLSGIAAAVDAVTEGRDDAQLAQIATRLTLGINALITMGLLGLPVRARRHKPLWDTLVRVSDDARKTLDEHGVVVDAAAWIAETRDDPDLGLPEPIPPVTNEDK